MTSGQVSMQMGNLNVDVDVNLHRTCSGARFWLYSAPEFCCFTSIELVLYVATERLNVL